MPDVIITPNLGRVDFTTGSVTPRTESIYIDPVDGLVFTGKISASAISTTTFSSSNIYITSSQLVIADNVITLNALTPYKRYAGIEMYDSGSGTLSNFLWDSQGDYFFLSGSNVNGKVITGPDGQNDLTAGYIPKATGSYKLGNSVIYDSGNNIGIGLTNPSQKLEVAGYVMAGEGVYRTSIYGNNGGGYLYFGTTSSLSSLGSIGAYGALFNINSLNNDISFQYNSGEKMRITTGGHLGLGITTPTSYVNSNSTYFRPSTDGLYSSIFATTEAVVNLISSGSADGAAVGGVYFTRARAQGDAHHQIAAIRAFQAGTSNTIAGGTLQFFTKINGAGTPAASPQMVILSDGNVGIGLTPATRLDVSGSISIRGTAVLQSASDVFAGGLSYDIYGNIRVLRSQSSQGDGMYIGYAGNGGPLRFFSNSGTTEFMTIATSGNVGINNTNPSRKLHVVGDIGSYKDGSNSISGHLYIANTGNTQAYNLQLNSTGTSLNLWTYDNANGWKNSVTFAKAGNVGIGTTIPSASLHINSTTSGATLLRTDGTNGTLFNVVDDLSDSLLSVNNSAGLPVFEVFADDRIVAGQYNQNDLVVINNKVGIGTNNPANKLYVSGSVSIGSGTYNISAPTNGLIVEGKVGVGTNSVDSWAQLKVIGTSALGGIVYVTDKIQALSAFPGSATHLQLNTDGGNVGIGTTLPVAKLQVNGNISGSSFTSSISNAVGFLGTASWASNAVSATSATSATSASYALTATTATTANNVNNGQLSFSSGSGISISTGTFTANQSGNTAFTISLVSNSVTVGSTAIALGGSATTIAGLSSVTSTNFTGNLIGTSSWASNATTVVTNANLTGDVTSVGNATTIANNAVTTAKILDANVTNAKLTNSSLTIGSTAISLGGTASIVSGLTSLTSTNITASNISASATGSFGIVGIGTNSSSYKLDVIGDARVSGGIVNGGLSAQWTLSGGGTALFNGYIFWSNRIIAIPVERTEFGADGYIDITCPTSGTITYYNSSNVTTTVTCDANGIPTSAWESLYYEVTPGQSAASDPTKFRLVNYQNSTWRPSSNWLLICTRNGDGNFIKWIPGQVIIPNGGAFDSSNSTNNWQIAGTTNYVPKFTAANKIGNSAIYDSSGNIGIGTTVANGRVESYYASNAITFNYLATNLNVNSPIPVYGFDVTSGAETRSIKAGIGYERHLTNGRGTLHFYNDSVNDTSNLSGNRNAAGDIKMSLDNSGNVGIGTTIPTSLLELSSSTASSLLHVKSSGTWGSSILFISSSGRIGLGTNNPTYGLFIQNYSTTQVGQVYVNAALNSSGKGVVIDSATRTTSDNSVLALEIINNAGTNTLAATVAGNVGIGSSSPGGKLDVSGPIRGDAGANYPHSFTNTDSGNTHWTNRGDRLLTSNGTNWATDGRDPIIALVTSGSGNATTIANSIGIALHNESITDNTFSPAIAFSNRSNSTSYNTAYATIIGKKTGQGVDSNWSSGELHFYTMPSGAYVQNIPSLLVRSDGVGIGTTSFVYGASNRGLLEVYGSTDSLIALRNSTANFYLHKSGNNFALVNGGAGYIAINNNGADRILISSNGNVGIGTTVPDQKLDVEGRIRTRGATGTGGFEIGAATTGTAKWRIEWDSASDSLDFNWVG